MSSVNFDVEAATNEGLLAKYDSLACLVSNIHLSGHVKHEAGKLRHAIRREILDRMTGLTSTSEWCGKIGCKRRAVGEAHGSIKYKACAKHLSEIQELVNNE